MNLTGWTAKCYFLVSRKGANSHDLIHAKTILRVSCQDLAMLLDLIFITQVNKWYISSVVIWCPTLGTDDPWSSSLS